MSRPSISPDWRRTLEGSAFGTTSGRYNNLGVIRCLHKPFLTFVTLGLGCVNSISYGILATYSPTLCKKYLSPDLSYSRVGGNVDIMAGPSHLAELVAGLDANGIGHSVMIEDVQSLTEERMMPKGGPRDMDWESYHPIEDMYDYFDYLG